MPIEVELACWKSGGWLELSPYGWKANSSMIGFVRPLALYAAPMSVMKAVGEWVSRPVFGRSIPRGETAPPQTTIFGETALSASYASASSASYAGAAASLPSG